jgi:hypothetical protein
VENASRSTSVVLTDAASEASDQLTPAVPVLSGGALEPAEAAASRKRKPGPIVDEAGNAISGKK